MGDLHHRDRPGYGLSYGLAQRIPGHPHWHYYKAPRGLYLWHRPPHNNRARYVAPFPTLADMHRFLDHRDPR